ncbi:SAM-dependent methyltransferase [Candidatus Nomurabacteria bacterium]|nr:SAM-dependent methyltransferase [Candidatus Nomurabacteria bacterium]
MFLLKENETIEDLQIDGYRLIQSMNGHRFGEDSVLLANHAVSFFVNRKKKYEIYDLGCGCGAVSFLLAGKLVNSSITGVEIQAYPYSVYIRNILLNDLSHRVSGLNYDWNTITGKTLKGVADIVVSNPPYFKIESGPTASDDSRAIARSFKLGSETELARAASYLLKSGGMCFIVYRSARLPDMLLALREFDLEPVNIRFVHAYAGSAPKTFLVSSRKSGKPGGLIVDKPLVIFDSNGVYSEQLKEYYGKSSPMTKDELYRGITKNE